MEEEIPEIVKQLVEMEFSQDISMQAYNNCSNKQDVSILIEWIQNYQEKQNNELSNPTTNQDSTKEQSKEGEEQVVKKPISDLVDQNLSKQLQEMGNSKIVAEKALFMTQKYKSIDAALEWIDDHCYDEDFNEELFIIGEQQPKKQLTKEEAKAYAQQKLAEVRARKAQEEAEYQKQSELNRIKMTKTMGDNRQVLQDAERQRDALMAKKQRQQDEIDKQKMLEILRRDKEEKFGKKFATVGGKIVEEKKEKPLIERIELSVKSIIVASPQNIFPDKAKVCLQTIKTFTENILNNPNEEKYKKINLSNKAVQTRIVETFGGVATLELIGFVNDSQFLTLPNEVDVNFLRQCIAIIQKELNSI